jgi:hypothetical protein
MSAPNADERSALLTTLGEMWGAAESEVVRIDVRERLAAMPNGRPLSAMEIRHRRAMRGIRSLIERIERSPVLIDELIRLRRLAREERTREQQEQTDPIWNPIAGMPEVRT